MNFNEVATAKKIIDKAKNLKRLDTAKIFINLDKPYHTRKEDHRLRKKKFNLIQKYPDDDIKLVKGKLFHNGSVVDKFDLNNQLFH